MLYQLDMHSFSWIVVVLAAVRCAMWLSNGKAANFVGSAVVRTVKIVDFFPKWLCTRPAAFGGLTLSLLLYYSIAGPEFADHRIHAEVNGTHVRPFNGFQERGRHADVHVRPVLERASSDPTPFVGNSLSGLPATTGAVGVQSRAPVEPKLRVVVPNFWGAIADEPFAAQQTVIRRAVENRLARCADLETMAGADLDQLVQELHRQQRMTPLHNKETMVRIGNFTGATAGLFGAVHSTGRGSVGIQAELIDLSTSEVLASARAEIRKESALESAVDWLADQILATLTTAEIESPRDGAPCGRQITVKGHAKFVPETWRIWVTVAPSLNGHHYPQKRLSPEADGSWFSHSIYAGDEGNSRSQQQLFTLCVVLVDEQADERLGRAVGTDLQLDDFGDKHCRMLAHIDLSRSDDSVPTVANNHN